VKNFKPVFFILIIAVFAFITGPVYSQNQGNIVFNFNAGNFGIGGNMPFDSTYGFEVNLSIINLSLEDLRTNLGIGFSPLMLYGWLNADDNSDGLSIGGLSLLNVNVYWNAINVNLGNDSNFFIGPFTAVNYMFTDEVIHWNSYVFTAGIQMGFRANFGLFNYNIFSIEVGYRNISGEQRYYFGGKLDLVTLFLVSALNRR